MKHGLIGTIGWLRVFLVAFALVCSGHVYADTVSATIHFGGDGGKIYSSCAQVKSFYTSLGLNSSSCTPNVTSQCILMMYGTASPNSSGGCYNPICPSGYTATATSDWYSCTSSVTPSPTPTPNSCTAGTSLGAYFVPVPGMHTDSANNALFDDLNKAKSYSAAGFPSCIGSCVATGPSGDKNAYGDGSGTAFVSVQLKTTGASCSGANTASTSLSASPPPSKSPLSPADCPTNTTFGQVNGSNVCVNNAPLPSQASSPASQVTGPNALDPGTGKTGSNPNSSLPSNEDGCASGCGSLTGSGGGGGGSGTVNIPTDYNRESTQKSILQKITEFFDFNSPSDSDLFGDQYKQNSDDFQKKQTDSLDKLSKSTSIDGYTWTWHPESLLGGGGNSANINIPSIGIYIDLDSTIAKVRDFFGWILYALTVFSLFRIFTGSKE